MIRALFIVIGVLAALLTGVIVLFTFGTLLALLAAAAVLALAIYAALPESKVQPVLRSSVVALLILSLLTLSYGVMTLVSAFTDVSGSVEPADPQSLTTTGKPDDLHAASR